MLFKLYVSEKITLVLRSESDAEKTFELVNTNRDHLRQWFPWVDTTHSSEDSRKFIASCKEKFEEKKALDLGILYDGVLVGSMGFHTINSVNEWAEIGYWISKEYEGKGIVTTSVRTLIDYAFNELHLHRVQIKCDATNLKSKAIPERLGFVYEGLTRENHKRDNKYTDGLTYSILRHEWNSNDVTYMM